MLFQGLRRLLIYQGLLSVLNYYFIINQDKYYIPSGSRKYIKLERNFRKNKSHVLFCPE